ncbi:crotonase/enoyl-CoA hydratase family protein [Nakamurella sp. YIM 132087]|uniref:Crotonase/enoyl-CoA hydratase family protein n=1 Tax=Nakamurella alba TaxID=2665158 RepID=A0A7K1FSZ7_9ACTN|nr:crotonase/enoyl-CoA hydratase family protein [Nakamurella alba]MTD15944.1 crotonase/enoyl-CoA hydratase family protein [Nakamurella alba]
MSEVLLGRRGPVLVITLNRPEVRNAVDSGLGRGLLAAIRLLDTDPELRVGVITGAGKGFCAGMDLRGFLEHGDPDGIEEVIRRSSGRPLIAAVEGFAMAAGMEIALACDLIVAGSGALLGIPEVKVGLFAGGGGVLRLGRKLPYAVAMRMALTGDPITAEEAHRMGLVVELTPAGGALEAALRLADTIASRAPLGVQHSRDLLALTTDLTDAEFWERQEPLLQQVLGSADAREGAAAFVDKRSAVWSGR